MVEPWLSPDDAEWVKERSVIIWEGAGEADRKTGRMTELLADQLALAEFRRRSGAGKTAKNKRLF